MTAAQRDCLADALAEGYAVLRCGGPSVEAVEAAIRVLEGSGLFNAGIGSRLQLDGARRMDASVMEGRGLRAGAVAAIQQVRHPITAARLVMEETDHVLLVGEPATRFARYFKLQPQPPPRRGQRRASREVIRAAGITGRTLRLYEAMRLRRTVGLETVGAVALDQSGCLAAGASTGGIALMLPGRVGDTPLIGCGVYADDEAGAVSMTGLGESIIRIAVAKEITDRLATGASATTAARLALGKLMRRVGGSAGAIVLTPDGRFAIRHTSPRMSAGYWTGSGSPVVRDRFR
jgi:beta-aspartyl-peptidase (threonine type)